MTEYEDLKSAQEAARKTKNYVIFDAKENRIIEISN